MGENGYYTIKEAADLARVHPNTIRRLVKAGTLHSERVKGKYGEEYRISEHDLYHSGIPSLNQGLGQGIAIGKGVQDTPTTKNNINLDTGDLLDRLQELSMKVGGYENATLALKEAKEERKEAREERDEYRRKFLEAEERSVALKGVIADMKVEMYTPWWRRKRR